MPRALVTFADVDTVHTPDTHTAAFVAQAGGVGYRGTFALDAVNQAGDSVGWTFNVADSALDDLAAGQTLTQRYDVTVDDGHGGSASQTVTIVITGTNDVPVIGVADVDGGVTERADLAVDENTGNLTDSGTIAFTDVDLTNTHTVAKVLVSATDSATGLTTAERGSFVPSITDASTGDGAGEVTWTYTVAAGAVDDLAAGQTITQVYTVTVTDSSGTSDSETVTIVITGTNDVPVIGVADVDGGVTERADLAVDENTGNLTDSGTIAFTDVDLTNTHTVAKVLVSATDSATGLTTAERGSFVPSITDASTGDGAGEVTWTYTVAAGAVDDLAAGQTITQVYTVTVTDSSGTSDSETVTIVITGTNDVPVIGVADVDGGVTERADLAADENTGNLTDSGTIAFTDVDLTNTHTVAKVLVSATDSATGLTTAERGSFVPSITDASAGDGAGEVTWTYTVAAGAVDDLAAGQTITQVYTVTVTDSSGTSDSETVTIVITGTNDVPVIGVADVDGGVTERADLAVDENTGNLTDSGTIAFTDVDLTNTHTVAKVLVSATDSATGSDDGGARQLRARDQQRVDRRRRRGGDVDLHGRGGCG